MLSGFSHVRLFVTPWSAALQAPLSTGFSRREYWNGLSCPPPGDLPDPVIKPVSPVAPELQGDSLLLSHWVYMLWIFPSASICLVIFLMVYSIIVSPCFILRNCPPYTNTHTSRFHEANSPTVCVSNHYALKPSTEGTDLAIASTLLLWESPRPSIPGVSDPGDETPL